MDRKKFVLSWGRKMFFGLSWPIMSIIGILYFQNFHAPQTFLEWGFLILAYLGNYGALNAGLYFLLFYPLVNLAPTYYFSRFFAATIITLANAYVLVDAIVFHLYRFHINKLVLEFLLRGGVDEIFSMSSMLSYIIIAVTLVALSLLWLQGNVIWKSMKSRFSNPVNNGYLAAIFVCVALTQISLLTSKEENGIGRLTAHFPFSLTPAQFAPTTPGLHVPRRMFYPAKDLVCTGKENKNILLVVLDSYVGGEFSPVTAPTISHYSQHGIKFTNHFGAGQSEDEGYFSLIYSLPPTYLSPTQNEGLESVLMHELKARKYETNLTTLRGDGTDEFLTSWTTWTKNRSETSSPFFSAVRLSSAPSAGAEGALELDRVVGRMLHDLWKAGQLDETIVVFTAASSGGGDFARNMRTPLSILWPGRPVAEFKTVTSHYDVVPTIMKDLWKCKNPTRDYSFGNSLFEQDGRRWLVGGNSRNLSIVDFSNNIITTIESMRRYEVRDFSLNEVSKMRASNTGIFKILGELNRFHRR